MVVIAIIAILAAILFPVFARARENARRASCQSNEKNIALGFKQYIQDNGEKYPPAMITAYDLKNNDGIKEYIKSTAIFYCPSDSDKVNGSYGYKLDGENESAIDDTTTRVLLNETSPNPTGPRHFAGMNAAYVDGHVKWGKGTIGAATDIGSAPVVDPYTFPLAGGGALKLEAVRWDVAGLNTNTRFTSLSTDANNPTDVTTAASQNGYFVLIFSNSNSGAETYALPAGSATFGGAEGTGNCCKATPPASGNTDYYQKYWSVDLNTGATPVGRPVVITVNGKTSTFYVKR